MASIGNIIAKCLNYGYAFYAMVTGFIVCGILSATGVIGWPLLFVNMGIGVVTYLTVWINNFNNHYPTNFKQLLIELVAFIIGSAILTLFITLDL